MNEKTRVVIAMSGGIDSSVAAAILKQRNYDVIGAMMRLWSEPDREAFNQCCSPHSIKMARRVAGELSIPFYVIDAQKIFFDKVVNSYIAGHRYGITPNPCLVCNQYVKWKFLLSRARAMGADFLATGHYARIHRESNGPVKLLRAIDLNKDQSYALSVLRQDQLERSLFPLGEYTKPEVRVIALDLQLPVANINESQDLCFLANSNQRDFLRRNSPELVNPGPIINKKGEIIGHHEGLAFYTIGQRKGLGITSPTPLYVMSKDVKNNILLVGKKEELGSQQLFAGDVNWISGHEPTAPFRAEVKIRYKAPLTWGVVTPLPKKRLNVSFESPLRDITPGQGVVMYKGDEVVGSGIILPEITVRKKVN
jgi:tRNA-specific 2-thiouridylase